MKITFKNQSIMLTLSILLVASAVITIYPSIYTDSNSEESLQLNKSFVAAATYVPGDYPSGLTLSNGDILNGNGGGIYNVTGNFTIVSGATVTITNGYKIVVHADNIIIAGILNAYGAGYSGGFGGGNPGGDGDCDPYDGRGRGGDSYGYGGGGAGHGGYGESGEGTWGGLGGDWYGIYGFENPIPSTSDIRMGGGGGGGAVGEYAAYSAPDGGNGGGAVYLESAGQIKVNGTIDCDGGYGYDAVELEIHGTGGGGGGAGGGILLYGQEIQISGSLFARGGAKGIGGPGYMGDGYDGGAGAGGRIKIAYESSMNLTGSTISVVDGDGYPSGDFVTYEVDYVMPSIVLGYTSNLTHHNSNTAIKVNISDSSGLQQVRYSWDGAPNTTIALSTSFYMLTALLPISEGTHILDVFAQDDPGNWNNKTFSFVTDDYSPSIVLESPVNDTLQYSGTIVNLTISDSVIVDQVLYNWDGIGGNQTLGEPYDIPIPVGDGTHNLSVYACDLAENWENELYSFIVDDSDPMITSPLDVTYVEGSTGNTISWILTDMHPYNYTVTMNDSLVESGIWISGMEVSIDVDDLTPGLHIFTIIALDLLDNLFTDSVVVRVLDLSTPTINHPDDLEFDEGTEGQYILWVVPDIHPIRFEIHIDGGITQSGPWDGSDIIFLLEDFSVGVFNITLVVYSESGPASSDSVIVTVNEVTTMTTTTTTSTTTSTNTATTTESSTTGPTNTTSNPSLTPGLIQLVSIGLGGVIAGLILAFIILKRKS